MIRTIRSYAAFGLLALVLAPRCAGVSRATAQNPAPAEGDGSAALDSLVAYALAVNPSIRAAGDRIEAARAAIGPAGAPPDPMLGIGITNFAPAQPGFSDFMTMKVVGVGQTIPYPGKLRLQRRIAEAELTGAEAGLAAARLDVEKQVKRAYYELVFYDRALAVLRDTEMLLTNLVRATEARYGVGTGAQEDVLRARAELGLLAEEAAGITEERRAALARLNAALDRPSEVPVENPGVPERIARAAVPASAAEIRFASAALGARALDSPLPPLAVLQEQAALSSPEIRMHQAMIEAQAARVDLARTAHLPDFEISFQYGQRVGFPDMISAMVSAPIPVRRGSRQNQATRQAAAELSALQAEHHQLANVLRARVAEHYASLERDRAQLALFVKSIIPQGRALLESATSGVQVGGIDFLTLLDSQATLYAYETQYFRLLTTFAQGLAELERVVGKEII